MYNRPYGGPPRIGLAAREKRKKVTIEQSVKVAKKKWDNIERKVQANILDVVQKCSNKLKMANRRLNMHKNDNNSDCTLNLD